MTDRPLFYDAITCPKCGVSMYKCICHMKKPEVKLELDSRFELPKMANTMILPSIFPDKLEVMVSDYVPDDTIYFIDSKGTPYAYKVKSNET